MPYYDGNPVAVHGSPTATVFLINEAPGPCEAEANIPLFGSQGGNVYRFFRAARIPWAAELPEIVWPSRPVGSYKIRDGALEERFCKRADLLEIRRRYMACSNAFNRWPKSSIDACDFIRPADEDVLSNENMSRLRSEVSVSHEILLICGDAAWLTCMGVPLKRPSQFEGTKIDAADLVTINRRLESSFQHAWYMGHTRRWSLHSQKTLTVLESVARFAGWL